MSVQDKLRDSAEYRREIDRTRGRFEEYAEAFAADVDRKRAAMAEPADVSDHRERIAASAAEFAAAREAMERYRAEFAAAAAGTLDASGFRAAVDQFRGEVADRRIEWEDYADAFADDARSKADAGEIAAAAGALRREILAHRESLDEYTAAFAADVDRKRAARADRTGAVESYVEGFFGSELLAGIRRRREPPASTAGSVDDSGDETTPETDVEATATGEDPEVDPAAETGDADPVTDESPAPEELIAGTADEPETLTTEATEPETAAVPEDEPAADEPGQPESMAAAMDDPGAPAPMGESTEEADTEQESMDEVAQAHDEAGDDGALVEELEELPYGTLKKAANALGYEGDLNSATKADLIEFFSEKDADEIRAALEE